MHGVFIEKGLMDWQIIQQEQGLGIMTFSGSFQVPGAAIEVGTEVAYPIIRVMSEDDNSQIIPWTNTNRSPSRDGMSGTWDMTLTVPAGGLYRIETGLDTKSTNPNLGWIFRGDVRLHVGVGDLFIVAGQSNSAGYGKDSAFDPPSNQVHLFRNRRTWDLASHPINESTFAAEDLNAEMGVSGISPYISFGKGLHNISHYPVGLISTALGGSPISRWDISQNGDLFLNMITKIKDCGNKAAGILWYQGCSDANPELSIDYFNNFKRVVMETRKELGYEIPFFTFQLNRQIGGINDESWGIVREAQRKSSNVIPGIFILPTINCSLSDGIHNNAHSSMMLGEKMAKLCGTVLYHTQSFLAPDLNEVVYMDRTIIITFRNMKRGFMIYSGAPKDCGFSVKDSDGFIPITAFSADKEEPNILHLTLEREPNETALISFGWEANPIQIPIVDEVTYLPPLSFYEFPIKIMHKAEVTQ